MKRCPNGTRKNKQGICKPIKTRCPNGTRKNKKTKNCEIYVNKKMKSIQTKSKTAPNTTMIANKKHSNKSIEEAYENALKKKNEWVDEYIKNHKNKKFKEYTLNNLYIKHCIKEKELKKAAAEESKKV
jgi:hypothetical protein